MTDTSPEASATLATSGKPATGNAPSGAMPPAVAPTLEEVQRELEELRHSHGNATEELKRHRSKLTAYEKKEAEVAEAQKAAELAQLSETEQIKKHHADAVKQIEQRDQQIEQYKKQLATAHVKLAAQSLNIIDPDMAALAIGSDLEYGDDGMPTNVEVALKTLLKNKPYLAPKPAESPASATPAQSAQRTSPPAIPPFSGRTSIPAPGSTLPGKPVRLSDLTSEQRMQR
jgi:hypothetical protein